MQSWHTLITRPLIERPPWLSLWEEDVALPDGQIIRGYLRSRARDYAMIFAVLPDGRVPLVRQYKHGTGRLSLDLPAGYLDTADETPLAAAQRELHEETGITAEQWAALGSLVIDTNRGDTRAHLFLATEAQLTGTQHLDPTECLAVSYHAPAELQAMIQRGEIDSLASVAGIMLGMDRLREGRGTASRLPTWATARVRPYILRRYATAQVT